MWLRHQDLKIFPRYSNEQLRFRITGLNLFLSLGFVSFLLAISMISIVIFKVLLVTFVTSMFHFFSLVNNKTEVESVNSLL